jgi:hypothetical protein
MDLLNQDHHLFAVNDLCPNKRIQTKYLPEVPYIYRWWFPMDSLPMQLLKKYNKEEDYLLKRLKRMKFGKREYCALYVGKSNNGRERFGQHIHGPIQLSTLRKTIAAILLLTEQEVTKDNITNVLRECYFEWIELKNGLLDDSELMDCFEMMTIAIGYYPLNMEGNTSISEEWKNSIMDKRKELKDYK